MPRFALISEGITDAAVIESILSGIFRDDAIVNPLMPLRDATDMARVAQNEFSNWELVLEYLGSEQSKIALATNDYLIVHIDTDQGEHEKYGLSLHEQGRLRPITEIVESCRQILRARIHNAVTAEEMNRVLFAIPVLTTECWLAALHGEYEHTSSTANNCEKRLQTLLKRAVPKTYVSYLQVARPLRKAKVVAATCGRVPCMRMFVGALPAAQA